MNETNIKKNLNKSFSVTTRPILKKKTSRFSPNRESRRWQSKKEKDHSVVAKLVLGGFALFKLDYFEQFYPNQSFARLWNPGVKTQRLIPKD
jgi:hypothetical protein